MTLLERWQEKGERDRWGMTSNRMLCLMITHAGVLADWHSFSAILPYTQYSVSLKWHQQSVKCTYIFLHSTLCFHFLSNNQMKNSCYWNKYTHPHSSPDKSKLNCQLVAVRRQMDVYLQRIKMGVHTGSSGFIFCFMSTDLHFPSEVWNYTDCILQGGSWAKTQGGSWAKTHLQLIQFVPSTLVWWLCALSGSRFLTEVKCATSHHMIQLKPCFYSIMLHHKF